MTERITPNWEITGLEAFSTTRRGGISAVPFDSNNIATHVGDDVEHVASNRQKLLAHIDAHTLVTVNQVHGSRVIDYHDAIDNTQDADAIYCNQPLIACAILTADCVPIVVAGEQEFAVIHGGWRSLAAGIIEDTLSLFDTGQNTMQAWLGPAICARCYQVGSDMLRQFDRHQQHFQRISPDKWLCDLPGIARSILQAHNIRVFDSQLCTYEHPDLLYSYRRQAQTGRMATIAWIDQKKA